MTEYDYSPDAYERYIEKQRGIARWTEQQAEAAGRYANPFLPTEVSDTSRSSTPHVHTRPTIHRTNSPQVSRSRSAPTKASQSSRHRSQSTPRHSTSSSSHSNAYYTRGANTTYVSPHRVVYHHTGSPDHSGHSSRSSSRAPRDYTSGGGSSATYASRPPPSRSHSHSRAAYYTNEGGGNYGNVGVDFGRHSRSKTLPVQYTAPAGQPVIMHKGHRTYVIVPNADERLQVRVSSQAFNIVFKPLIFLPNHLVVRCIFLSHLFPKVIDIAYIGQPQTTIPQAHFRNRISDVYQ